MAQLLNTSDSGFCVEEAETEEGKHNTLISAEHFPQYTVTQRHRNLARKVYQDSKF